jgi:hypothetical protein
MAVGLETGSILVYSSLCTKPSDWHLFMKFDARWGAVRFQIFLLTAASDWHMLDTSTVLLGDQAVGHPKVTLQAVRKTAY